MTGALPPSGSLRLRFMLAVGLWVTLGILAIWLAATAVFARHIERSYHEELEVHVRELARLADLDETGQPHLIRPLSDPRYEEPLSGFYWQVGVAGHEPLKSESMTRGSLDENVAHSPDIAHEIDRGPTGPTITYGMIKRGPAGEEMHIVIATDQSELEEDIASFTREISWWLASLAALLLATGLAIIVYGLKPLARLSDAVNALRGGEARRLEGRYPAEISPVVNDLNAYIEQTSELVSRGRVQAGNLAHSLRTPLAVLTDEAERMATDPATKASGHVVMEQAERMQQQIDYQLARARSAASSRLPGNSCVLPDVLVPVVSAMRRLHPGVDFVTSGFERPVTLQCDPVNLSELASILLDNAGKWASDRVELHLGGSAGRTVLTISDDGPGMTDEQIARACEIGTRFDPSVPGSGLGLAIARDLAQDLGAELELECEGRGLVARVTFAASGR